MFSRPDQPFDGKKIEKQFFPKSGWVSVDLPIKKTIKTDFYRLFHKYIVCFLLRKDKNSILADELSIFTVRKKINCWFSCVQFILIYKTSNARLRTRSALSRRNHVSELATNYLFKADAIHVSLSRTQPLYTIKQVTLVSATRLTFD